MSISPQDLRAAFDRGENLMSYIRARKDVEENDEQTIELSYDLQAGSYVDVLRDEERLAKKIEYTRQLAALLEQLQPCTSLLEAGVGEATTFKYLLDQMVHRPGKAHGFDLCWSRVAVARRFLGAGWAGTETLLTAARLTRIPYLDNSFDIVFTSHAMEPNHGRESVILEELYRVASRYVVLLEPAYELASEEARRRMEEHRYVRDLPGHAARLGMKVVEHRLFLPSRKTRNPTALILIEKDSAARNASPRLACPEFRTPLTQHAGCYFSAESMRAYPMILNIPVLRLEHAVIASKLEEFSNSSP